MAQKVVGYVRFQVPAGKATPAPPVGPALGQYGVNIGQFTKDFNERTKGDMGMMIPVVITVYSDRSFTFITKTPPAALLIKKACGIESGSGVPQRDKVATISKEDVRKIAEQKMPDLNCTDHRIRHQHDRRNLPFHGRRRRRLIDGRPSLLSEREEPRSFVGGSFHPYVTTI